eukprot:CAMPEP_0171059924 /NCGR_PEP_ID=MMETSP0766_2-20121228/3506_1 /TAXON_ID=439317 /ORGANISM="Gambierdiscus australes, Strain CAWD 149" /LENGTH=63 /DNA_ID=CAMNT_0011515435 /DNA_START=18 /DNA_END=205 /DNA_ORIENTATION=+
MSAVRLLGCGKEPLAKTASTPQAPESRHTSSRMHGTGHVALVRKATGSLALRAAAAAAAAAAA